jgi:hypothetical protein
LTPAAEALIAARRAGAELTVTREGGLRWRSGRPLPDSVRQALAEHKVQVVLELTALPAVAAKECHGWSADPPLRKRQWAAADAIDAAYLAGDLPRSRAAVVTFIGLIQATQERLA